LHLAITPFRKMRLPSTIARGGGDGSGSPQGRGPQQIWVTSSAAASRRRSVPHELSEARPMGLRAVLSPHLDRSGRSSNPVFARCPFAARQRVGVAVRRGTIMLEHLPLCGRIEASVLPFSHEDAHEIAVQVSAYVTSSPAAAA
jgi:hypothetical protein